VAAQDARSSLPIDANNDQWTLLARARALDTTCFLAAAGQAYPGQELARASSAPTGVGGSLVASPLGEVIESAGPDPQLVVCNIDVDTIPAIRDTLPVLRNRSEFAQRDRAESPE
jgi:predicted amidohydrolase